MKNKEVWKESEKRSACNCYQCECLFNHIATCNNCDLRERKWQLMRSLLTTPPHPSSSASIIQSSSPYQQSPLAKIFEEATKGWHSKAAVKRCTGPRTLQTSVCLEAQRTLKSCSEVPFISLCHSLSLKLSRHRITSNLIFDLSVIYNLTI